CDFVSNIGGCAQKDAQEAPQACERDLLAPSLRGAEKLIHLEVAMPARLAFLPAFLIAAILSSVAPPISRGQTGAGGTDCHDVTLDVRLQTGKPGPVIARLQASGIRLIGVSIDNNEKTPSTHIYVGRFGSADAAARFGDLLVARGLVDGFLITAMPWCADLGRPRRAGRFEQYISPGSSEVRSRAASTGSERDKPARTAVASSGSSIAGDLPVATISRRRR